MINFSILTAPIGAAIKGFFGFRKSQGKALEKTFEYLKDESISETQRTQMMTSVLLAEMNSESFITSKWRPLLIACLVTFLTAYILGFNPKRLSQPMPEMVSEALVLLKWLLTLYLPSRGAEKVSRNFALGKAVKSFVEKKI